MEQGQNMQVPATTVFSDLATFEGAQRMAKMLSASDMVPIQYRGNLPNAVIALELAQRLGASPLAVMQSCYIVHGKPSWSASFIIACINASGRFSPLRFEIVGDGDDTSCFAWAYDLANDREKVSGPPVSIAMAKAEGWYSKNGSKWKTMPELMLRYRAATLFGRLYAPDILMGMGTVEEVVDSGGDVIEADIVGETATATATDLNNELFGGDDGSGHMTPEPGPPEQVEKDERKPARVRTRPKVVEKFKAEIDAIDTAHRLDTWRLKHRNRIARELPKESDQDAVFAYAQERYEALLTGENGQNLEKETEIVTCPNGNGRVPVEYCKSECKALDGCPVHED